MPTTHHEGEGPQRYMLTTDPEIVRSPCSHCGKRLRVRAVHVGKFVRCPKCNKKTQVVPATDGDVGDGEMTVEAGDSSAKRRMMMIGMIVIAILCAIGGIWLGRVMFG
jgi:hypothetical protein